MYSSMVNKDVIWNNYKLLSVIDFVWFLIRPWHRCLYLHRLSYCIADFICVSQSFSITLTTLCCLWFQIPVTPLSEWPEPAQQNNSCVNAVKSVSFSSNVVTHMHYSIVNVIVSCTLFKKKKIPQHLFFCIVGKCNCLLNKSLSLIRIT